MSSSDWIMILAILLAPVIAVQASQYLERRRQIKEGKLRVFKILMATRASTLAPAHVEALNMIDVEFYGDNKKDKAVVQAWKAYLDHLADQNYPKETWGVKRTDLLVDLLYAMADCLGYDFDKTHIKNSAYTPKGYGEVEDDQFLLRKGLLGLLKGKISLPVYLVNSLEQPEKEGIEEA